MHSNLLNWLECFISLKLRGYRDSFSWETIVFTEVAVSEGKNEWALVHCTNGFCLSVVGKVINSFLIGFHLSAHTECQCEPTACEADEGQDGAGVTVFTVAAVWWAHLCKLIQEVLRGLRRFRHRRRGWRRGRRGGGRWGGPGSAALVSLTAWKWKRQLRSASSPPFFSSHHSVLCCFHFLLFSCLKQPPQSTTVYFGLFAANHAHFTSQLTILKI